MKEIIIMAGAKDPDRNLLSLLKVLFPECTVKIIYAGSNGKEARISVHESNREMGGGI